MGIATINPATGESMKSFDELSDTEIEQKLALAASTYVSFRLTTFAQRSEWMLAAGQLLDEERDRLAEILTTEMGKTLASARQEVEKSAKACRFYADNAETFLSTEPADAAAIGATDAYVCYQPLGPVLAVMPWNYPLWQAMRFAIPALMAANVGLLKHASNVPQTALYIEDLFLRAGFPRGAFQTLLVSSGKVAAIIRDERVVAVTLTGSNAAGESVAQAAGSVTKKLVLELGGSDPFIVMPSADLARAAQVGVTARCLNNGQSCIAAKRFIVHESVADEFEGLFVQGMSALTVGDPMDASTDIGPLSSIGQREEVAALVGEAVKLGARVLCGGEVPSGAGAFYPPTVLTGITAEMRIDQEEVFGPVATIYRVADVDEAVRVANSTPFGLGANVWTQDASERERFVRDCESGMVFINGNVTSYPELPFGGVKASGYGRELAANGIREFCNTKSVWVGK